MTPDFADFTIEPPDAQGYIKITMRCSHGEISGDILAEDDPEQQNRSILRNKTILATQHRQRYPDANWCVAHLPSADEDALARLATLSGNEIPVLILGAAGRYTLGIFIDPQIGPSSLCVRVGCAHNEGRLLMDSEIGDAAGMANGEIHPSVVNPLIDAVLLAAQRFARANTCDCVDVPSRQQLMQMFQRAAENAGPDSPGVWAGSISTDGQYIADLDQRAIHGPQNFSIRQESLIGAFSRN